MTPTASFDLQRFLTAQESTFSSAVTELEAGRKRSHWMWFIFPQMRGLGSSALAQLYGVGSIEEAQAYLSHPVLGPRLKQCTAAVLNTNGRSLNEIFGTPDDLKFCSSMTLFAEAAGQVDDLFHRALDRFCQGHPDPRTLALLPRSPRH